MTETEAESTLRATTYWHYPFELPWGKVGTSKPGHDDRHHWRYEHFFVPLLQRYGGSLTGKRVLDLACCQGFWSFHAVNAGADYSLGIDSSPRFILEAQAIGVLRGTKPCEFRCAHLEDESWWHDVASVEITLFLGLFYHLTDSVSVLRRAMALTRETIVIDTEVSLDEQATLTILSRDPCEPTTCGSSPVSRIRLLPSRLALQVLLTEGGFEHVTFIDTEQSDSAAPGEYKAGKRLSLIARRTCSNVGSTTKP